MRRIKPIKKSYTRYSEKQTEKSREEFDKMHAEAMRKRAHRQAVGKLYFQYRNFNTKDLPSKQEWLSRYLKNPGDRLAVDCRARPPSSLFRKEIQKGLLKRIRERVTNTNNRTYLVVV